MNHTRANTFFQTIQFCSFSKNLKESEACKLLRGKMLKNKGKKNCGLIIIFNNEINIMNL